MATPFLGVFKTPDDTYFDIASGTEITSKQIKPNMTPFNGVFVDKDGTEHDLRDFIGGGGDTPTPEPGPVAPTSTYDKIIRTQAEFEALYNSPNWLGAASIAFIGDGGTLKFTRAEQGLLIPPTVKRIDGFNSATIEIIGIVINATTNKAAMWYETQPTTNNYSISGITTRATAPQTGYGFYNCTNLINCTSIKFEQCDKLINCYCRGNGMYAQAYIYCTNLINCTGFGGGYYSYAFYACKNLINCTVIPDFISGSGPEYGLYTSCENLINCNGVLPINVSLNGPAFDKCVKLTNCTGNGTYAFLNCSYLNNCKEGIPVSKTSIWGGTWLFRDDDSCQLVR